MSTKKQKIKQLSIILVILAMAIVMGAGIGGITWIIKKSPDISNYGQWKTSESTVIYASNGKVLTKLYKENRSYVPISKIPKDLQHAIVAIEDERFYEHFGLDIKGILRAIWVDLKHMAKVEGASTITQQLARNALLSLEQTFSRKFQEMYIALQFERMYTKDEILEFYLNEISLGDIYHNAYGVQSAAKYYFNKDVWELTLAESALIAGLPKGPNAYSPYRNLEKSRNRRNIVLKKMLEHGYIAKEEYEQAIKEKIHLEKAKENNAEIAPYFVSYIRKKLIDKFGSELVYTGGLKVYTTLDLDIQNKAKETTDEALEKYIPTTTRKSGQSKLQPQLGIITIDPNTGYIKAMIGGRGDDKFNRTTQAYRQPGSSFKPFVYATAIEQGAGTGTIVDDTLKEYKTSLDDKEGASWIPKNYNNKYLGPTTLRIGLAKSINVMAVKLLDRVGIDNTIRLAKKMGIKNLVPEDRNLSLALGGLTKGVTPLEMATSYGVLATGGIKTDPIAITKVEDNNGNVIWSNETSRNIVLKESVAYLVTDMLRSAVSRGPLVWGTGWRAYLNRPMAGKTGTTSNYSDAWFVGYTPDLVTTVWIGEDSPTRMEYPKKDKQGNIIKDKNGKTQTEIVSSGEAARLWGDYMRKVVQNRPVKDFKRPDNIIAKEICIEDGQLPNQYCPPQSRREELYIEGTEPTKIGKLHKETAQVKIDKSTGLIATDYCPSDQIVTKTYQVDTGIIVDKNGVPIKKLAPETKLPLKDENGNYIYEQIPSKECDVHGPQDAGEEIKDKIFDFFNILRGR
ncbi:transglycosylase domain-containing protein [Orenia marismortui]|uniref:transglycosylase domain-containing protein n=1 Tax=Orenia marismortui TaxID=46469 RepID=UPI00036BE8AC|nr:PBP1A family penicillin-binding protein [Orenia marismortui]